MFFYKLTLSQSVLMCGPQDESLLAHVSQLTPVLPLTQTPALNTPSHLTGAHSISPAPEGVIACTVEQNLKNKDDHKKYNKASALEAHPFMQTTVLCYSPALCTLGEQPWMISLSPLTQHSQNDLANNNL